MRRRRLLRSGLGAGAALLAGCAGDGSPGSRTPTPTADRTATASPTDTPSPEITERESPVVTLADRTFDPVALRVAPGTTVTWTNESNSSHTVQSAVFHPAVATEWTFYSADFPPGREVSHEFGDPGVYEYYCTVHGRAAMCGVVLVGAGRRPESLPCTA
ncbi:plastocyanin/azurin family copper-binding protein [Halobacteriales archaeon Cl-PHB]